jgi:DNA-binding LytR/AlgR family response regulator
MGLSFVHIGNDNSLEELLQIPSYYTDIAISLVVIYSIGLYIQRVFRYLDQHFNWDFQLLTCIKYQFILGLVLPVVFALIVEIIYLKLLGIPLKDSPMLYLELPIVILFLVMINLFYFILYFRKSARESKANLEIQLAEKSLLKEQFLLAKQGNQNVNIPLEDVAYFFSKDKLTFLVTTQNKRLLFDRTMAEVMEIVPPVDFYRLNRQLIVKRSSIAKYNPTETRRLKIELNPSLPREVYIPKTRVSSFYDWMKRY